MSNTLKQLTELFAPLLEGAQVTYLPPSDMVLNDFMQVEIGSLRILVGTQTSDEWGYALVKNDAAKQDGFLQKDGTFDVGHGANMDRYFDLRDMSGSEALLKALKALIGDHEAQTKALSEAYVNRHAVTTTEAPPVEVPADVKLSQSWEYAGHKKGY